MDQVKVGGEGKVFETLGWGCDGAEVEAGSVLLIDALALGSIKLVLDHSTAPEKHALDNQNVLNLLDETYYVSGGI